MEQEEGGTTGRSRQELCSCGEQMGGDDMPQTQAGGSSRLGEEVSYIASSMSSYQRYIWEEEYLPLMLESTMEAGGEHMLEEQMEGGGRELTILYRGRREEGEGGIITWEGIRRRLGLYNKSCAYIAIRLTSRCREEEHMGIA